MHKNVLELGKKRVKSIMVTDDNEVTVKELYEKNVDDPKIIRTVVKKRYQLVTVLNLGNEQFAQCVGGAEIDWYNLSTCEKVLTVDRSSRVKDVTYVAGELFFNVVDEEEKSTSIYDSTGARLNKDDASVNTKVVFGGCGPVIKKEYENGEVAYYTLEGYPA